MNQALTPNPSRRYDVAIVGYGPVGALLARLLSLRGLSVAVFEREAAAYPLPRAVHFDGEVMRVFQSAGVTDELNEVIRPGSKGMHFVDASGKTLMIRRATEGFGPQGWHTNYYFHQPDLEKVLRNAAQSRGNVHVAQNAEVVSISEAGNEAILKVKDRESGCSTDFRAKYAVGCDGANSSVRGMIGSTHEDLGLQQRWLVADLILRRPQSEFPNLPDYTIQHCDPAQPTTACYVTGRRRRWEMMIRPQDIPEKVAEPENVWKTLSRWVSPDDAILERTAIYTFRSLIANGWRKGRLMIAGDAAHQTPPFLGQGMCAGIRDCANLAWKLELAVKGSCDDSILDTYESERRPHVHAFIDLAVKVGEVIQADGPAAAERDRQFEAGGAKVFSYPEPQLGPGIHTGLLPAGQLFPQPFLSDGVRFDDVADDGFVVVERESNSVADEATRKIWDELDVSVISQPACNAWLEQHHAVAVILRPDRYIFGVATDTADLYRLADRLRQICPTNKMPAT